MKHTTDAAFVAKHPFSRLLEKMEDTVLSGIGVPLTPWTIVNGDTLVPMLDRIREVLPEELIQARQLLDKRDELLTEAQQQASQILEETRQYADQMVQESELLKAVHTEADRVREMIVAELETARRIAQEEADSLRRQAVEEARAIRRGAEAYAEELLINLDRQLTECQQIVRNGQRYLKQNATPTTSGRPVRPNASRSAGSRPTNGGALPGEGKTIRESVIHPQHYLL